jgi:dienelactone hydrolase
MLKKKNLKLILWTFFILLYSFAQFAIEGIAKETVSLTTDDGKKLKCTYFPPPTPKAPGVILLPDTGCNRSKFGSVPKALNKAGFAVLAMDFRYKSIIGSKNRKEAIRTIIQQDLVALAKYDAKSGIDFLSSKNEIDSGRIALIGTSLGSRIALISGVEHNLNALVLISLSGEKILPDYKPIKQFLSDYGEKPILFMTAKKDWGGNKKAAEHNKLYYKFKTGAKELKIWIGSGHGIDILKTKESTEFVATWLKSNL